MKKRPRPSRFADKIVLITGGNAGLGLAAARAFANEGAKVMIAARRRKESATAVAQIVKEGGEASFVEADMADAASIRNMVGACVEHYGGLDIAFNNAGITGDVTTRIAEADEDMFDRVMSINVRGVWLCMKYEVIEMLKRGGGAIVNCGSTTSIRGGSSPYCGSKHAVFGMTKGVAMEYATRNIRVNAVLPGMMFTDMTAKNFDDNPDKMKQFFSRVPMARSAAPEEVASAVLWLASDESRYVTGTGISVDGGWST